MVRANTTWVQVLAILALLSTAAAQTVSRLLPVTEEREASAAPADDLAPADVGVQPETVPATQLADPVAADQVPDGPWGPWYTLISSDGYVAAKFSAVSPDYLERRPARASDVMVTRQGEVIGMARVGPGGVAQIGGVRDGRQGLIAYGPDGYAAFGIYASRETGGSAPPILPSIDVGMVPLRDLPLVQSLIAAAGSGVGNGQLGSVLPIEQIPQDGWMHSPRMVIDADGFVRGKVVLLGRENVHAAVDMDVFLIRGGRELASATTDARGRFECAAESLSPGYISLVVRGTQGIVVVAAMVERNVDAETPAEFVSFLDDAPPANPATTVTLVVAPITPLTSGGFSGPFGNFGQFGGGGIGVGGVAGFNGGGGGIGTGGGGLGALLAGLGGAALGSALSDGDTIISAPGP